MQPSEKNGKILSPEGLEEWANTIRAEGKTIALLNGSFDLLHAGHLHMFREGAKTADVFLVALNSDASIQQYKSPDRPIIPLNYRLEMVAALQDVDYVTWFEETNPIALIEKVRPDIHVNGVEYGKECIEAEAVKRCGGQLHLISFIDGLSTSAVIEKIQNLKS